MNILIVDDDASFRTAMQRYLESRGHDVVLASDGIDAETLVRQTDPALIISDIRMRRCDGIELVKRLRARGNGVPIALMSGVEGMLDQGVELEGIIGRLEKPFELSEIEGLISQVMRA